MSSILDKTKTSPQGGCLSNHEQGLTLANLGVAGGSIPTGGKNANLPPCGLFCGFWVMSLTQINKRMAVCVHDMW